MFTVQGYIDGVAYNVSVDSGREPGARIVGSARVMAFLTDRVGDQVDVTPTGPMYTLDLDAENTVLAALLALTDVVAVEGDAPEVVPPPIDGVVY